MGRPVDFNAVRERRAATEIERLAAAQRVHDRIHVQLREAGRREFERESRSGLSEQQIAEVAVVTLEHVRHVLGA